MALLSSPANESTVIRTDFLIKGPFVCYSKKSVLDFSKVDQPTQLHSSFNSSWNETQPQTSGKRRGGKEGGGGSPCPSLRGSGGAQGVPPAPQKQPEAQPCAPPPAPRFSLGCSPMAQRGVSSQLPGRYPGKAGLAGRARHSCKARAAAAPQRTVGPPQEKRATKTPGGEPL